MPANFELSIRINADGTAAIQGLRRVGQETENLGSTSQRASAQVGALGGAFKSLLATAAGIAGIGVGLESFGALVKYEDEARRLDSAYRMIYGSAGAAADALAFVGQMANDAGVNAGEVAKAFQSISAAAQGTAMAGKPVRDIFEAIVMSMGKLGKNSYDTAGALLAIEQMMSKGKVQAEELRGQLGERLPGAFRLVAEAMGVSTVQLDKMLVLGNVYAEDMLPKLAARLQEVYGSSAYAKTFEADLSRFKNTLSGPGGLLPVLNEAVGLNDKLGGVLQGLTKDSRNLANAIQTGVIASALAPWADAIKGLGGELIWLDAQIAELIAALSGIPSSGSAFVDLINTIQAVGAAILALPDNLTKLTYAIAAELDILGERWDVAWDDMLSFVERGWMRMQSDLAPAISAIKIAFADLAAWIADKLAGAAGSLSAAASELGMGELAQGLGTLQQRLLATTAAGADMRAEVEAQNAALDAERRAAEASAASIDERRRGLDQYALAARSAASDLMDLLDVERRRAQQAREEAALFAKLTTEQEQNTFGATAGAVSGSGAAEAALAERVQNLSDKYLAGVKAQREYEQAQKDLAAAVTAGAVSQEQAEQILAKMREEVDKAVNGADKATEKQRKYNETLDAYVSRAAHVLELDAERTKTLRDIIPQLDAAAESLGVSREAMLALVQQETGLRKVTDATTGLVDIIDLGEGTALRLGDGFEAAAYGAEKLGDELRTKLSTGLTLTEQQAAKAIESLDGLIQQYLPARTRAEEFAQAQAAVAAGLAAQKVSATEATIILEGLKKAQADAAAGADRNADAFETAWTRAVERLDDAFADMWENLISGTGDTLDTMKKALYSWLAEVAHAFLTRPITVALTASLTGTSATAGAASSAVSGASPLSSLSSFSGWSSLFTSNSLMGSLGTWLGGNASWIPTENVTNLMGVSNWQFGGASLLGSLLGNALFDGKYSGTGSSVGSTAGAIVGSMFGPVGTWIGGMLGGTAGGWLGSLFGDDKARFGGYATSFSGKGFEDNVSSLGAFGLNFGISDAGSKNMDASGYQATLDGLAQVSQALAQFYGTDISASIQNRLRASLGDFNDWGNSLDQTFQQLFNAILTDANDAVAGSNDVGSALAVAVQALGGLTGSAETMANRLQQGMQIVSAASALMASGFKPVLGLSDDLSQSSAAVASLVSVFTRSGDDVGATLTRITSSLALMESALTQTGSSLDALTMSATDLVYISQDLTDIAYNAGLNYGDLATLQASYYDATRSDEEKLIATRDAAQASVQAFNDTIGNTSNNLIDSTAELRAFVESLDLTTDSGRYAYVQALMATSSFVALEDALASLAGTAESVDLQGFIDSLAPDTVALDAMLAKFAEWGMAMPATSDALYALIIAGKLTDEQMTYLAQHTDELGTAFSAVSDLQSALIDRLQAEYDAAKDAASEASDAYKEEQQAASEQALDALKSAYDQTVADINDQLSGLNETVSDLQSTIGALESAIDSIDSAMRGLTTQLDGIDETRQSLLAEAAAATADILAGGAVPSDLNDIIGGLSAVDPNDFATRAEYEAAVQENLAALEKLKSATDGQLTEAEKQLAATETQIDLLQDQLDLQQQLYDDAVAAEQDRLDQLMKAEDTRLAKELADLDAQFEVEKKAIEDASADQLVALDAQTTLLGRIAATLEEVTIGAVPAFASGGYHSGGWRLVGEQGPELEYTGPSTILPSTLTSAILAPSGGSESASEVRALRAEVRELRAVLVRQAADTAGLRKTLGKWDGEGLPADREDYAKTTAEAAA